MAVTFSGSLSLTGDFTDIRTAVTGSLRETGNRSASVAGSWAIASGTAAGLADKGWADRRTVLTAATDILDLAALITNAFAEITTFVKVRGVAIIAAETNTTTLQIARPATNGALLLTPVSATIATLGAGGFFGWCDKSAGFTVTTATADLIHVINSAGASAVYDVMILGTSA